MNARNFGIWIFQARESSPFSFLSYDHHEQQRVSNKSQGKIPRIHSLKINSEYEYRVYAKTCLKFNNLHCRFYNINQCLEVRLLSTHVSPPLIIIIEQCVTFTPKCPPVVVSNIELHGVVGAVGHEVYRYYISSRRVHIGLYAYT